jgi:hypothetical protein
MNWITYPMGGAVADRMRHSLKRDVASLSHAVELTNDGNGRIYRPLCRVKLVSLCLDDSLATSEMPECEACCRAIGRAVEADPETPAKIDRCVKAARRPCLEIVPVNYLLCSDGQYRGAGGFPVGVTMAEPVERKLMGYAYRHPSGTTFGTRGATEEELRTRWEASQDAQGANFKAELLKMSGVALARQFAYWLKGDA